MIFRGPRTLAARLVLAVLAALLAGQIATLLIYADERREAIAGLRREQVLERVLPIARLALMVEPARRAELVEAASTRELVFSLTPQSPVADLARHRENGIARRLKHELGPAAGAVLASLEARRLVRDDVHDHDREDDDHRRDRRRHFIIGAVAIELGPDAWLSARAELARPGPELAGPYLRMLLITGLALALAVIVTVRHMLRPLKTLADAADGLGRGDWPDEPLPERGPSEVVRSVRAFNSMQARLKRFISDRTTMLAALGHDLRTPLTTLRLRAEFVEDEETRRAMIATLDEMQAMVEATLAFARDEARSEPTRPLDLPDFVAGVVTEMAAAGLDLRCGSLEPQRISGRPVALKRMLRNLIDNGVRYGNRVVVSVGPPGEIARIVIEDEGPGIAEEDHERVFEPFERLETSRSRDTGGVGLGLPIARSIARAHGGDVTLETVREDGVVRGLRVIVSLPAQGGQAGGGGEGGP